MGDKDNFIHIYVLKKKGAVSEHRTRNVAFTSLMRYHYTNFMCCFFTLLRVAL